MAPRPAPAGRAALLAVVFLILILSPCLGLAGGVAYLSLNREGVFTRWRSLGAPPGGAAGFVAGDTSVIFAAAEGGAVYRCDPASRARDACWLRAEPPFSVDPRADYEHSVISGEPPAPPPGQLVDALYVSRFYAELAVEARYHLLADGTVWVWLHESGSYDALLVLLGAPVLGLCAGLAAILLIALALPFFRRRAPAA